MAKRLFKSFKKYPVDLDCKTLSPGMKHFLKYEVKLVIDNKLGLELKYIPFSEFQPLEVVLRGRVNEKSQSERFEYELTASVGSEKILERRFSCQKPFEFLFSLSGIAESRISDMIENYFVNCNPSFFFLPFSIKISPDLLLFEDEKGKLVYSKKTHLFFSRSLENADRDVIINILNDGRKWNDIFWKFIQSEFEGLVKEFERLIAQIRYYWSGSLLDVTDFYLDKVVDRQKLKRKLEWLNVLYEMVVEVSADKVLETLKKKKQDPNQVEQYLAFCQDLRELLKEKVVSSRDFVAVCSKWLSRKIKDGNSPISLFVEYAKRTNKLFDFIYDKNKDLASKYQDIPFRSVEFAGMTGVDSTFISLFFRFFELVAKSSAPKLKMVTINHQQNSPSKISTQTVDENVLMRVEVAHLGYRIEIKDRIQITHLETGFVVPFMDKILEGRQIKILLETFFITGEDYVGVIMLHLNKRVLAFIKLEKYPEMISGITTVDIQMHRYAAGKSERQSYYQYEISGDQFAGYDEKYIYFFNFEEAKSMVTTLAYKRIHIISIYSVMMDALNLVPASRSILQELRKLIPLGLPQMEYKKTVVKILSENLLRLTIRNRVMIDVKIVDLKDDMENGSSFFRKNLKPVSVRRVRHPIPWKKGQSYDEGETSLYLDQGVKADRDRCLYVYVGCARYSI